MFNFYAQENDKGFPGMKANVTVDVCDSFAAEGGIDPGEAVIRGTNPDEQVKAVTTAADIAKIIGIAAHTHKEPNENGKYFADGDSVSVMTLGDIYVLAADDVTAGDTVAVKIEDGAGAFVGSGNGTAVAGMTYVESGAEGEIVRVRIRK